MKMNRQPNGPLEDRVRRLERSAKETRWSGVIIVLFGILGFVLHHLMMTEQVQTRQLILEDEAGRVRGALTADDQRTMLFIKGVGGSPELDLSATSAGIAVSASDRGRILGTIFVGSSGTYLRFFGNDEEDVRFSLSIEANETRMEVSDGTGRPQTFLRCITDPNRPDAGCQTELFDQGDKDFPIKR